MKKLLYSILFSLILITNSFAAGEKAILNFIEPTNAVVAGVQSYSAWYIPTNNPTANPIWFNQTIVGNTNILILTNVPSPSYLVLTSANATNQSAYSDPVLYDLNSLALLPVTNAPAPLLPPGQIKIKRIAN